MAEHADRRDVLFDEALVAALQAGDIAAAMAQEHMPSAEDLTAQVSRPAQRQAVFDAASAQEAAYRASFPAPAQSGWQPVPLRDGTLWTPPVSAITGTTRQPVSPKSGAVALAGMYVPSAITIFAEYWGRSWSYQGVYGLLADPPWLSIAGWAAQGFGAAALLLAGIAIILGVAWCVGWVVSPEVRRLPSINGLVLAARTFFLLQLLAALVGSINLIESINQIHGNYLEVDENFAFSGQFWPAWIIPSVAFVVYSAAAWRVGRSIADSPFFVSSAARRTSLGAGASTAAKESEWREALRDAIESFIRTEISRRIEQRFSTVLKPFANGSGLSKVRANPENVWTTAEAELVAAAAGMDGGAIALSGPRGVGKSYLLARFCKPNVPENRLGLKLDVPVNFDAREFMLHLFRKLCEFANDLRLATGPARRNQAWLQYQATRSDGVSAGAGWGLLSLGGSRGISRTEQPKPYPDILDDLKIFLREFADAAGQANPGCRLVIGIDELDRIEPIAKARDFLSELRPLFEASDWLFVLSISDEALREAGIGRPDHPDVFDSAIDETVRIGPFSYRQSVTLMGSQAIGMPEPFTALFHCLSGGMPRSMLRLARAAAAYAALVPREPDGARVEPRATSRTLAETATYLVARAENRRGNTPNPALRAVHAALVEIFSGNCDQGQIEHASGPGPGSFETLTALLLEAATDGAEGELGDGSTLDGTGFGRRLVDARRAWELPARPESV